MRVLPSKNHSTTNYLLLYFNTLISDFVHARVMILKTVFSTKVYKHIKCEIPSLSVMYHFKKLHIQYILHKYRDHKCIFKMRRKKDRFAENIRGFLIFNKAAYHDNTHWRLHGGERQTVCIYMYM